MSPIIYEVLDVGTGITDAHGELVSSGVGIPTFVGVLDKAVKRLLELHGAETIRDGDLFVTNDPYYGGVTHLNDVVIALGTVITGTHPDTGRRFTTVEPQMGGWGATSDHDKLDAMYSACYGETFNCPVEICESRYGIDVAYKRLNETEKGRGRHNGGRGRNARKLVMP